MFLIAIQPSRVGFGAPPSPEVSESVERLAGMLGGLLRTRLDRPVAAHDAQTDVKGSGMTAVLLLMVIVPALGAVLAGVLGKGRARVAAVTAAAVVAALAVWSVAAVFGTSYRAPVGTLPWLQGAVDGPVFGVLLDPLGSVLLLVATLIGFLTVLYSVAYMGERNRDHAVSASRKGRTTSGCSCSWPAWWASRWRPTSCSSSCSGS